MTTMTTTTHTPRALTSDERQQFECDGFLVVRGLFKDNEVSEIRELFTNLGANGPVPGLSEIAGGLNPDEPLAKWPRMMNAHKQPETPVGAMTLRYLLDKRVEDVLWDIMDQEPVAAQHMFYFKAPGSRGQDLHQDNFYLRVAPGTCYAAWLSVDDADTENGTLMVVPGTGDMNIVCPDSNNGDPRFFTTVHVPVPEGREEVPLLLKAGDVLFFNGSLIHGSYPNTTTDRFRRAFISHYVPRASAELSQWYKALTFDGQEVTIDPAVGGGACGDPAVTTLGPH